MSNHRHTRVESKEAVIGILSRIFSGKSTQTNSTPKGHDRVVEVRLFPGDESLEVVGESFHQDVLWGLVGRKSNSRVRKAIFAMLVPEPVNPADGNAISVRIEGQHVGYLSRSDAAALRGGLLEVMERNSCHVLLQGVIVGGGYGGEPMLGVWLDHDPAVFGRSATTRSRRAHEGELDSGFSDAWLTDEEDDSYDLSWYSDLPEADRPAIAMLRKLLESDPDPIDRHFQFAELERRLYRSRDLYPSALDEYDDACRQHDSEMDTMRVEFMRKWGRIPRLEIYRQMTIRQVKLKEWAVAQRWAERGLAIYGDDAARVAAVEDLTKRANHARVKQTPKETLAVPTARQQLHPIEGDAPDVAVATMEELVCSKCQSVFTRLRVPGRKPTLCPDCRSAEV